MDSYGNLYFGIMEPISIACWDSTTSYTPSNFRVVEVNRETLQFASGIKVVKNFFGEESLWVNTNRFQVNYLWNLYSKNVFDIQFWFSQRLRSGTVDWNDINFRIQAVPISQIIHTGGCRPQRIY